MTGLIATAQGFYADLARDNTKAWWEAHKETYDTRLKAPALALLETLSPRLQGLTGLPIRTKLFRPHRDVRFSKDKTPYNTHLHMMWSVQAGARQNPVFFFGIGLGYVTSGAGIMGLDKPVLEDWRRVVDLDTERVLGIVEEVEAKGFTLREPALNRVPPPYDAEHRAGRLLRMKEVTAGKELAPDGGLEGALMAAFTEVWPLNRVLIEVAEA